MKKQVVVMKYSSSSILPSAVQRIVGEFKDAGIVLIPVETGEAVDRFIPQFEAMPRPSE